MVASAELFELKAKDIYQSKMLDLVNFNPFSQKNPIYINQLFKAISTATFTSIKATMVTTADTGFGSSPPIPGVGIGKLIADEFDMHSRIYTLIRESVRVNLGIESLHDVYPPSQGNSGEMLQALIQSFTLVAKETYDHSIINSIHPLVYSGNGQIDTGNGVGIVLPLQPNIMINQILGMTPLLIGKFWPKFVEAYSFGFFQNVVQKTKGNVAITGVCVPNIALVCNLPMIGVGTGTLTTL